MFSLPTAAGCRNENLSRLRMLFKETGLDIFYCWTKREEKDCFTNT